MSQIIAINQAGEGTFRDEKERRARRLSLPKPLSGFSMRVWIPAYGISRDRAVTGGQQPFGGAR